MLYYIIQLVTAEYNYLPELEEIIWHPLTVIWGTMCVFQCDMNCPFKQSQASSFVTLLYNQAHQIQAGQVGHLINVWPKTLKNCTLFVPGCKKSATPADSHRTVLPSRVESILIYYSTKTNCTSNKLSLRVSSFLSSLGHIALREVCFRRSEK